MKERFNCTSLHVSPGSICRDISAILKFNLAPVLLKALHTNGGLETFGNPEHKVNATSIDEDLTRKFLVTKFSG